MNLKLIFWILFFILCYSYIGYLILLYIIKILKNINFNKKTNTTNDYEPEVTIFIAAYNEQEVVHQKVKNTNELNYPKNKLKQVWVTDGSTDKTVQMLKKYPEITVYHEDKRSGKTGAINRGIDFIDTPVVVFTDANTLLGKESIKKIVELFRNPKVGCVAGEKRISPNKKDIAVSSGEGIYWRIESKIKQLESDVNSTLGAAGELFAIRKELFEQLPGDTILDDFVMSLRIAQKGYKIKYTSTAYSYENASSSIKEELKRKTRIAAGCFQTIGRLSSLLNPFKYGFLSFQFFSHKIMRWTLVPLSQILIFIINIFIVHQTGFKRFYFIFLCLQLAFYFLVLLGYIFQSNKTKYKLLFTPYYAFLMNYAIIIGFNKYIKGNYSVNWEKSERA